MRAEIGLGDLLVAWHAVGRDPDLAVCLARVLGLHLKPTDLVPDPAEVIEPRSRPTTTRRETKLLDIDRTPGHGKRTAVTLEPLSSAPPPQPIWLASDPLRRAVKEIPAPVPPLFRPERERALHVAVARRLRSDGDIDVGLLVRLLARRTVPRSLPRHRVPSIRGGVQIIVDRSHWMTPFHADLTRLVDRFRAVVGEAVEELCVFDLPPDVSAPADDLVRPWTPPMSGTALVVASDLGRAAYRQGRRRPGAAWLTFIQRIHASGFEPVVIVPGRRQSYLESDQALRQTLLLGWDRSARVAEVARFRKERSR